MAPVSPEVKGPTFPTSLNCEDRTAGRDSPWQGQPPWNSLVTVPPLLSWGCVRWGPISVEGWKPTTPQPSKIQLWYPGLFWTAQEGRAASNLYFSQTPSGSRRD